MSETLWPIRLFNKSVLKQRKYKELTQSLGSTEGLRCLDIGSDNGVISYLFRKCGGSWCSADLDTQSVSEIKNLVKSEVFQIDGGRTPFEDNSFDCVVVIDFLEHIPNDVAFVVELNRILKPNGRLIINVPHIKNSLLRKFRLAIGQTDEKHGHLRPGYTPESLECLIKAQFTMEQHKTYSKFFSEFIDTLMVQAIYLLQRNKNVESKKGAVVTGGDLKKHKSMFRLYSLIYPVVLFFSKLDHLLFFSSGYMLIVRAKVNKEVAS